MVEVVAETTCRPPPQSQQAASNSAIEQGTDGKVVQDIEIEESIGRSTHEEVVVVDAIGEMGTRIVLVVEDSSVDPESILNVNKPSAVSETKIVPDGSPV